MAGRIISARDWHRQKLNRLRAGTRKRSKVQDEQDKPSKRRKRKPVEPRVPDKRLSSLQKRLGLSLVDKIKPWRTMSDEVNRIVVEHKEQGWAIPEGRQIRDAYKQAKALWDGKIPEDELPFVDDDDTSPL